jgi:predicted transcriptional regulator
MKILVEDKDIKIDDLSDLLNTSDKSLIKIKGQGPHIGEGRKEEIPTLIKELVAIEGAAGNISQKEIADIYGVTQSTVSHLSNGKKGTNSDSPIDEDLKETTDRVKHKIENAAVAKLMSTLDLFDPHGLEGQMEVITAATKLAGVVEKIKGRNSEKGDNNVHLHLYQPRMKKVTDFEVIEVG